jgi:hypothetical protein
MSPLLLTLTHNDAESTIWKSRIQKLCGALAMVLVAGIGWSHGEAADRDLALNFQRVDRSGRCWFNGKCAGEDRGSCPQNDVDCTFNRRNRRVGPGWFCVHHKESDLCRYTKNSRNRGLTEDEEADRDLSLLDSEQFARVDRSGRCWFNGKCSGEGRLRRRPGAFFCIHQADSDKCRLIKNNIRNRGLTEDEEADRDLSLLDSEQFARVDKYNRCWFNGKCSGEGRLRRRKGAFFCIHQADSDTCMLIKNNIRNRGLTEDEEEADLA